MLGIAASISTMKPMGVPNLGGDISEMNTAIPKLIGTPIAIAMAELTRVPTMYGSAPYDSLPSTGFQSVPKRNPIPSKEKMGTEPWTTEAATSTSIKRVYPAAPITTHLKIRSPLLFPRRKKDERNFLRSSRDCTIVSNPLLAQDSRGKIAIL